MALRIISIVAILWAIVIGLYFAGRAGFRWLRRRMEARQRRQLLANQYQFPEVEQPSHVVPIWVAIAQLVLLGVLSGPTHDKNAAPITALFGLLVGAVTVAVAFVLHGLPQHRRTAKYVALWMGVFSLQIGLSLIQDKNSPGASTSLLAILPLTLLAATAISHVVRQRIADEKGPLPLAFTIHRLCMALGPAPGLRALVTFFAMRQAGMFPGYLMLRYFVRPYITGRPFLYLRAFDDGGAQSFLGAILAPAAGARGVVVGLIHEEQTGEFLHRQTDHAWYAEVFALPDSAWQRWVIEKMNACNGVVIDMSLVSLNLMWEFEQAMRRLPASRVLVVSRTSIPDQVLKSGVPTLTYSLASRADQRNAKRQLERWVDTTMQAAVYAERPPASEPTGGALPIVAYSAIALWAGMAMCFAFAEAQLITGIFHRRYESLHAFELAERVWVTRAQTVELVASLLMLAAASLFPLSARSQRLSTGWFIGPCIAVAMTSLMLLSGSDTDSDVVIELVKGSAFFLLLGCIIVSCIEARATHGSTIDLERLILALLAPAAVAVLSILFMSVVAIAGAPDMIWLFAMGRAFADCAAAYALIVFIRQALAERSRGFMPPFKKAR